MNQDINVDVKIGADNNPITLELDGAMNIPIEFKVSSSQTDEEKEIVCLIKEYYLI